MDITELRTLALVYEQRWNAYLSKPENCLDKENALVAAFDDLRAALKDITHDR